MRPRTGSSLHGRPRRGIRRALAGLAAISLAATVLGEAAPAMASGHELGTVVSANPADWTPNALDGYVYAFAQVGNTIVVGGTFTKVQAAGGGPVLHRASIFAFDAATGAISTTFVPKLDGIVWALEPAADGHSVYVGGAFSHVNGDFVRKLVELNVSNGRRVAAFGASADAVVRDLALRGSFLYVSGAFMELDDHPRTNLGRVNAITGALGGGLAPKFGGARIGETSVHHFDINPDGSRLVAIGDFTTVNGVRRSQVAMFDLTTSPAKLASFESDRFDDRSYPHCSDRVDAYVRDVEFSPDGSYFVTVATGGPSGAATTGTVCDAASRWETDAGLHAQPTWVDYTGGDTFWSVAVTGTAVYVGGHERWVNNPYAAGDPGPGAVSRPGIAALDPRNGLPLSWNPTRDRGMGVFVLYATDQGLWVGSDTDRIGLEYHGKLALMPTAGGTALPDDSTGALPNPMLSAPRTGRRLASHPVQGQGFGTPSLIPTQIQWDDVRSAMLIAGLLYTAQDDGTLLVRGFDPDTGSSDAPAQVPLLGLQSAGFDDDLRAMSGMFFDQPTGRWYYTVAGDPHLYYRYFTMESQTIGGVRFAAASGAVWSHIAGMTLANGTLYTSDDTGNLWRQKWTTHPVGTRTMIGGPSVDGRNWRTHGLFVAT